MLISLSILLTVSFLANIVFSLYLLKVRDQKKVEKLDKTAEDLLGQLLIGPAIVKIEVIEKGSLLQWKG